MNEGIIILIVCLFPLYLGILSTCAYLGKIYAVRIMINKTKVKKGNENG